MSIEQRRWKPILWSAVGILLISMLAFPLGFDQAIFEVGGAAVGLRGAIPFRDFLELKQPLIFYVYSLATLLFGRHEWAPRLLDALYHAGSLYIFYRLLRRSSGSEPLALLTVFLYTISYVGSGFWMTMEPESYALLPQLGLVFVSMSLDDAEHLPIWVLALIAALSLWALVMLKITLGLIVVAVLLYLLITRQQHSRRKVSFVIAFVGGFVVLMAGSLLWLSHVDALGNLLLSFQWLRSYASFYPLFGIKTFQEFYYHIFPSEIITSLSPTFVVLAIVFIVEFTRNEGSRELTQPINRLMSFCLLGLAVGLASIAFERKAFNYQFTRIFWALMPVVAAAMLQLWSWMRISSRGWSWFGRIGITIAAAVAFVYSPLPRLIDQPFGWGIMHLQGDTEGIVTREANYSYPVAEMRGLVAKHQQLLSHDGDLLIWGNAAQLYFEFGQTPPTIELVNAMFMTSHTPQQWIDTLASQWRLRRPILFICEQNDARLLITRTTDDSYAALLKIPSLRSVLEDLYEPVDSTMHFRVYRLRGEH